MSSQDASAEIVTLWRPTGQEEIDLVAASGWRAWPPRLPGQPIFYPVLNRWYAEKITREWNVPRGGIGYVTRFDVRKDYLDQFPVQQAGGRDVLEYWIPAERLEEFNANITGAIMEEVRYLGSVPDEEFARAATGLGREFPDAWRAYLQGQSWLSRGWLASGCYLTLLAPEESLDWQDGWEPAARLHPGILLIGSDGSNELIAVDTRDPLMPVVHLGTASGGWAHTTPQGYGIAEFIAQVEAGTFEFTW